MIMKKKPIRKKLLETKVLQEWSGVSIYTQTHYDHNNPPPKVIQGYKFNMPRKPKYFNHVNIFYQKSQTETLYSFFYHSLWFKAKIQLSYQLLHVELKLRKKHIK